MQSHPATPLRTHDAIFEQYSEAELPTFTSPRCLKLRFSKENLGKNQNIENKFGHIRQPSPVSPTPASRWLPKKRDCPHNVFMRGPNPPTRSRYSDQPTTSLRVTTRLPPYIAPATDCIGSAGFADPKRSLLSLKPVPTSTRSNTFCKLVHKFN